MCHLILAHIATFCAPISHISALDKYLDLYFTIIEVEIQSQEKVITMMCNPNLSKCIT
jgi:hypothetical protein